MPTDLPPFLIFFVGALLVPLVRGVPRYVLLLLVPVLGALNVWGIDAGLEIQTQVMGYTLTLVRADRLSLLFGYLFHLGAFIAIIYSLHLKSEDRDTVQHMAALTYAGSGLGAVFAGDLITLFVFWEILALSSAFLIFARGTPRSTKAGMRYLVIQVVSGVVLLAGTMVRAFSDRRPVVRIHRARWPSRLAHLHRDRHQGCLPARPQLVDRRVSRGNPHRDRLPERVHDQGRGVRARSRLPRH